jgi:hypothetical protein
MKDDFKKQNFTIIMIYIIWCISLFIFFVKVDTLTLKNLEITFYSINIKNGLIYSLVPIFSLLVNGLISNRIKSIIIFWRFKDSLPGSRAFSKYSKMDPRINYDNLLMKMGKFPVSPKEQNSTWYRIFKERENKTQIFNSHKNYILSRDIAIITFTFLIVMIINMFSSISITRKLILLGLFFMKYIVFVISTQNYAKRFICNVISDYSVS